MNQELQAAIELGRTLRDKAIAEYEERERQSEYRRRQDIMQMWVPYIAAARATAPEWVAIIAPQDDEPSFYARHDDYDRRYRPMTVGVNGNIPPLRAWTNGATRDNGTPIVLFSHGRWTLFCPEDTGEWIVTAHYNDYAVTSYPISQAPRNSFYLALAEAADEADRYQELLDEAARRNEAAATRKETIKFEKDNNLPPPIIDPLERIANYLERIAALYEQHHRF